MTRSGVGARVGNARWAIPIALLVSLFVAFLDRLNLSQALPLLGEHYGWSTSELGDYGGKLLGVFYVGYGISNIVLTPLAARFGARRSLLTIVCLFSLFTGLGAPASASLGLFVATRFLLGVGEGVHFPMMATVTKRWFPLHERSRANGLWGMGAMLATILTPVLVVPISVHYGWQTMLLVCSVAGLFVSFPVLYFFVYDTPRVAPYLKEPEIAYIESKLQLEDALSSDEASRSYLRDPNFYLALAGGILNNFCAFGVLNWLPTYFVRVKGLDFVNLPYASSSPYIVGVLSIPIYALLGDRFNRRVLMAGLGFLGTSLSVYAATVAPTVVLTLLGFMAGTACQTAYLSQEFVILQRILPAHAISKASGVYNGLCVLLGAVGGTVFIGQIVSITGTFQAGMISIVIAALLGSVTMFTLSRRLKY